MQVVHTCGRGLSVFGGGKFGFAGAAILPGEDFAADFVLTVDMLALPNTFRGAQKGLASRNLTRSIGRRSGILCPYDFWGAHVDSDGILQYFWLLDQCEIGGVQRGRLHAPTIRYAIAESTF